MNSITRSEALNSARLQYRALAERARGEATDAEALYIDGLATSWDSELERLASLGSWITVREDVLNAIVQLIGKVSRASITHDALVEWVDAFPDAVADLFPPSASTYQLLGNKAAPAAVEPTAGARNRQPALAPAA